ncbi:MAG: hypothetical protein M0C28_00280 [Candidatus Moduliflexus flocculans]|nr:hypothetical protein [Candidatus Moduliflexus flocculans]
MLIFWLGYWCGEAAEAALRGRGARGHDRGLEPLRGGHRHGHDALRAVLGRGAGHGGGRADRGAGDADAGEDLPANASTGSIRRGKL